MRVIYDISRLGECYREPLSRSGLSRVIENVAYGLVATPDCQVSFSATQSFEALSGALDYLKTEPRLQSVRFLATGSAQLRKTLGSRVDDLNAELKDRSNNESKGGGNFGASVLDFKVHKRVERRLLAYAGAAVKESRPFDPKWLSGADIFHSPFYPLSPLTRGVHRFLTVYDFIPILYPQFCVPVQIQFAKNVLDSIGPEDSVLCISQVIRDDLCNQTAVDDGRIAVTPLAAAPDLFYRCDNPEEIALVRRRLGIPDGPYILSLNTLEPRKNISQVVRAFVRLVAEQNISDLNLVLVGTKGWLYENILEEIAAQDELKGRIVVTGYVADEHLAALYSDAMAFVFPSFYEGFGLPPLEAMQCGVPVITSNTSSLPEVVGDAGFMFNPNDTDGFCDALWQLYRSASFRESMSLKSLAQARKFSWEKCVAETIAAYKAALA
jgi:glycosyltransferase involved in cell wall biosynthesis